MTPPPSLVSLFVEPLNRSSIAYMVTGGLATVIYGYPRMTLDVDLVVRLAVGDVARLSRLWPPADFYVPPLEVLHEESRRPENGHFNISHHETAMRADVYVAGESDLNDWALRHRVVRRIEGEDVYVAPIEAVILGKLRYFKLGGSDRHLRDIAHMLKVSGAEVDHATLGRWIARQGLGAAWDTARSFVEPA